MDESVRILRELVARPSVNPPGDEAAAASFIGDYFQRHGIVVKRQAVFPGRYNLIARLPGADPSPLVFTGHMDVVPVSHEEARRWKTDPFDPVVAQGRLFGRGATDMKGGLAAVMTAMTRLKTQGFVPPHDILLCATVDEEFKMAGSEQIMAADLMDGSCGIIVCEPTGLSICNASRGRTFGQIVFGGHTGHGSDPGASLNAIDLAHAFITAMKAVTFDEAKASDGTFWQVLSIQAGVEPGVIPDQCTLGIDARLGLSHPPSVIWAKADAILRELHQAHPAMTWHVTVDDEREPWITQEADPFLGQVKTVFEKLDLPIRTGVFPGTTDGTKLRRSGAPCIITGPGDLGLAHRENESVELAQVEQAAHLYEQIMRDLI